MKTEQLIQECLARGYCHTANKGKILDIELIAAMTEEIMHTLGKELPQTVTLKYDNFAKNKAKVSDLLDKLLK